MAVKEILDDCVFILGAGASYDAKCLLSSQMLDDLRSRISNKSDLTFLAPEKEAIKFLLSCLEYHGEWRTLETANNFKFSPNIEELALLIRRVRNRENFLPYPITGNWADKLATLEIEFKTLDGEKPYGNNLFLSIERKIKSELVHDWLKIKTDVYLDPLRLFMESNHEEDFRLEMFTFNYDTLIEDYFTKHNATPMRGFSSGEWVGFEEVDLKDFGRVNLYKLHGSLDWVRLTTDEFKERSKLTEDDAESIDEGHNPFIIFGQGTKTFSIEPFFSLIQQFKKRLSERKYLFVMGYSFFDPYINNLLIEAVRGTSKKIIIVNPYFGPDKIKTDGKYLPDGEFKEVKYPQGSSNLDLVAYIEDIQKNTFYSELPEFNAKSLNADSLIYLPIGVSDFLQTYFADNGSIFIKLINGFEKQRKEIELPFDED
jgi:hypothetical protein